MRLFFVKENNGWIGFNNLGNVVVKIPLEDFTYLGDNRVGFPKNGRYGVADFNGKVISPAKYDQVFTYSEGMAIVEVDNKTGYINQNGELVVPCLFYNAWQFSCGLAAVQETMSSPWGYIDICGNYKITPQFRSVKSFTEKLGAVHVNDGWGFINKDGGFVIKPKFALVNCFSEGLSAVTTNIKTLKYGFIDQAGVYKIKPEFHGPDMKFSEGLAAVYGKNGFGFIDRTGVLKIPYQFYNANHFSDGLCRVCFKKRGSMLWGYINKDGNIVIEPKFTIATDFIGGLAMVETKELKGYINISGEFVWSNKNDNGMVSGKT